MTRSSKTQGCFDASVHSLAGTEMFMSSIVLPFFPRKTCHSALKSPWFLDLNSMCRRSASLHLTNLISKTQTAPPLIGIWHLHTETLPGHIKTVDVWVCPDLDYPDIILILSWYHPDIILILSLYYPDIILILSWYYPDIILILSWYHPDIILILSWYHPDTRSDQPEA